MLQKPSNVTLLTAAVGTALLFSSAVQASDSLNYTIYGNVHLSMNDQDSDASSPELKSNTSSFGVKGGKKLDSGLEVIYQLEWQVDPTTRATNITDRDQWVGFKGDFGKIIFGTASSNYKALGGKVDPLYRTPLEGRGALMNTQSRRLHGGAGTNRGRMTKSINYTSPNMNGFSIQATGTVQGIDDAFGAGLRYASEDAMFYVDYMGADNSAGVYGTAVKVGGSYNFGDFKVGAQFEDSEEIDGSDYWFLSGDYKLSKAGSIKFSAGEADGARNHTSFAVAYDHKLDKSTNVYVGFGDKSSDDMGGDDNMFTVGARYKF